MKTILYVFLCGIAGYFLFKFGLYLYRPFFLSKTYKEIDRIYNNVLATAENDLNSAIESYKKRQSGNMLLQVHYSEEEMNKSIKDAQKSRDHDIEVHEKFLRLKERFVGNYVKLAEVIVLYRKYLRLKLKQHREGAVFSNAVTSGAMTVDEFIAEGRKIFIAIEENEKKIDKLLIYK